MATQSLVRSINDYLDADVLLEWRRGTGTGVSEQLKRVDRARRRLRRELADARPEDASLIQAAETLLDAQTTAAPDGDDRLQDQFLKRARQDVIERVRLATENRGEAAADVDSPRAVPLTARILVAIDDSKPSEWAVDVAAGLAQTLGAHVMVVHVVEPTDFEVTYNGSEVAEQRRRAGIELLEKSKRDLMRLVDCDGMLQTGAYATEIIAAARVWEADLIVMGTRGRGRFAQLVLGSTAEAVIREAPCPVVAVGREPERFVGQSHRKTGDVQFATR